jgi:hypothetical protein
MAAAVSMAGESSRRQHHGSRMGAAKRCQVRSDAVTRSQAMSLTSGDADEQRLRMLEHSVRIEGSGVQIPSAPPRPRAGCDLVIGLSATPYNTEVQQR